MKILHCLNHFLPAHVAGTEVYVMALMRSLVKLGIQSSVIIPNYGKNSNELYKIEDFTVFQYAEPSVVDRDLQMGKRSPEGLINFKQIILAEQPDIIHFHELAGSNGVGLRHIKLAKANGFKTMMTFHLSYYTCKTGTLMYKQSVTCDGLIREKKCTECWYQYKGIEGWKASALNKVSSLFFGINTDLGFIPSSMATALSFPFIIRKHRTDFEALVTNCDKLIVLAEWYKNILFMNGVPENKISCVPQGVPYNEMNSLVDEKLTTTKEFLLPVEPSGAVRLLFLGRISPFKGLHLLVDALLTLPGDKFELDIYGQNCDNDYEKELINKTAGNPQIRWKGRINQKDVVSIMRQYDVLCLCSTFSEMSPLVIQEAFAAGLPVLASDVYGNAEQIKDGINGWLFRYKDSQDLARKLTSLIDNVSMVERARQNLSIPPTFNEVAATHMEMYSKIIRNKN